VGCGKAFGEFHRAFEKCGVIDRPCGEYAAIFVSRYPAQDRIAVSPIIQIAAQATVDGVVKLKFQEPWVGYTSVKV
jgi:hypothetical protein